MNRLSIPSNFEAKNNQYLELKMTDINSVLIIGNIASGKSTFAADFSKLNNYISSAPPNDFITKKENSG